MYLAILMYGQIILGAVIEEKETRIAEILFSSVKPFTLMMGKLVGVSFVALTQLAIWALAFSAFAVYGVGVLASRGISPRIPGSSPLPLHLLRTFFPARLLHVRDDLCTRRIDGHDSTGRRATGDADNFDPRGEFLFVLAGES